MACFMKLLYATLFIGLITKSGTFGLEDKVVIDQVATGKKVQNKTEWMVTVANNGPCMLYNVKLSCPGFKTVEEVSSSILSESKDICTFSSNQGIYPQSNVSFAYAWDQLNSLELLSNDIACS